MKSYSEDPVAELQELTAALEDWLRFQRRLGWPGTPAEPEAPASEQVNEATGVLTLKEIRAELGDCKRCKLSRTRKNIVFGDGSARAALMFIGEGPGEEEDLQGLPFVGAAGQLLNNLLSKLGLRREEVYIANVVKCRPPGNREPEADESEKCLPFLRKQIEAIQPRVIVTLGRVATQGLLSTPAPLTRLRGQWQKYGKIRVMPTFHPSYLLRFPKERHKTWDDMQQVMEYLAAYEEN
ncbi:MAG: uracil-DNA glycosylase [Deltaproteobacteria bacterium]|nr:MAG: uracil-DNA glycosylase [Deltaproteobacteria bacterium]